MPTTLAFKPLIDLPEWRPIANAPAVSAAGTQLVAGLRNNSDRGAYVYMLVNATTLVGVRRGGRRLVPVGIARV